MKRISIIIGSALLLAACGGTATTTQSTAPAPAASSAAPTASTPAPTIAPETASPSATADPACDAAAKMVAALPDLTTAPLFDDMGTEYLQQITSGMKVVRAEQSSITPGSSPLGDQLSMATSSLGTFLPIYQSQLKDDMRGGELTSMDSRDRLEEMGTNALDGLYGVLDACES